MTYHSSPDPKRRSFPKKNGSHKSYGDLPNLNGGSKRRGPQRLPFSQLTVEDALAALGFAEYLAAPALSLVVICDDRQQTVDMVERTVHAGMKFSDLKPAEVKPRAIAQRCVSLDEIKQIATEENTDSTTTGLALLVELCKVSPADLVLGIGKLGQPTVDELRREAAKLYPDQIGKFVTQTELEQETAGRTFASEPDAFLLVALEHLYGVRV